MDFFTTVCDGQHPKFYALLGLPAPAPQGKKKLQTKQTYKLSANKRNPRLWLKNEKRNRSTAPTKAVENLEPKIQEIAVEPIEFEEEQKEMDMEVAPLTDGGNERSVERLNKSFFYTVVHQTASALKRFLRSNASKIDINTPLLEESLTKKRGPFCGWTALHIAAGKGDIASVELLLEYGAAINCRASLQSETALAVATWKQHEDIVSFLLENGADVHSRNTNRGGQQPIHIAAMSGNQNLIDLLSRHGATLTSVTTSNGAKNPIELSARMGKVDTIRYLHSSFSLPIDKLLLFSFPSNHPETIEYSLDHSSLPSTQWHSIFDNALACLDRAVHPIWERICMKLVKKFKWLSEENIFPFRMIQQGLVSLFKESVRYWNSVEAGRLVCFYYQGQSLLFYACACNRIDMVSFLLQETKMNVNQINKGETALIRAAKNGNGDLCSLLLDANANVLQVAESTFEIPLHAACRAGHSPICEILLSHSSPEKQMKQENVLSMNPLHIAASKLELDCLRMLVRFHGDVTLPNPKGQQTALHYACTMNSNNDSMRRIEVIDFLLSHGADIHSNCVNSFGSQSVVELACISPEVVSHLLRCGATEVSVEEINSKRELARKQLGKILLFEDEMNTMENNVIHNPQSFLIHSQQDSTLPATQLNVSSFKPKPVAPWKTVRLFLSSTFVDMQSEREYLIKRIIPRVKEKCVKKRIHLLDIDLRWGVTEEETESGKALEVCLNEARKCDIFCGLLGERYGWVPSPSHVSSTIDQNYQWQHGTSITQMEVEEGVFRRFIPNTNQLDECRAFFCFRDPSAHQRIPTGYKDQFIESKPTRAKALASLKERILDRKVPVLSYSPSLSYSSSFPNFTNLDELGRQFESYILRFVDELYPPCTGEEGEAVDPLGEERDFHLHFIELRSSSFLGRSSVLSSISEKIVYSFEEQYVIAVSGEAGSGKSSLMAKLVSNCSQHYSPHETYILPHFIGGSPSSISILHTLTRVCAEIIREFAFFISVETEFDALVDQFLSLLHQVSSHGHKKLLIFLDALNQLDASNQSHTLSWLPMIVPKNISIVVSCLPSDCLNVLKHRKHILHVEVPLLSKEDRNEIVSETLARYQKKLSFRQCEDLLSKSGTTNPLYLTMACEELRMFGDFERLGNKIFSLADDVPSLLDQILERLENEFGSSLVKEALGLLEISRFGLLEEELLDILSLSRFQWAELFLAIQFYLRPIGGQKQEKILDFFHRQFAKAVHRRYLATTSDSLTYDLHKKLAFYFASKIDLQCGTEEMNDRAYSEVIFHAFSAHEYDMIQEYLCSLDFIERKCLLGFTFDLVQDFLGVSSSIASPPSLKQSIQPFMDFCMANTHFLNEFPYTILQMAFTQPEKSPVYLAAVHMHKVATTSSRTKKKKKAPLLRWTNKPSTDRNAQEYRSLNIGARANCAKGSPNGLFLVTGDILGRLKVYNAATGEEIAVLHQSSVRITNLDFSTDGFFLIASSGSSVYLFDIESKSLLHEYSYSSEEGIEVLCVAFTPERENSFLCGLSNGDVFMNHITSSKKIEEILSVHMECPVYCCSFVPGREKKFLVAGNKQVTLFAGSHLEKVYSHHAKAVKGCAVASSGEWAVSCSQDRSLVVFSLCTDASYVLERHTDNVETCSITLDDKYIISGSWDKRVLLWDVESIFAGNPPVSTIIGEHAHFLNFVCPFGNDSVVSSSADTTVKLLRIPSESSLVKFNEARERSGASQQHHTELVCGMDYDPTRSWVATASWDRETKLFRADDISEVTCWNEHTKRVNDVCFSPLTFSYAVTASMDHSVKLWDMDTLHNRMTFNGHKGNVMAVVVSHDERYIASGSSDASIKFWDVPTGNCIDTISNAHSSWVDTLRFSQNSRMIASASVDGEAKVWNTENGVLLAHLKKHSAPILDIQWTHNDAYLITVGEDWLIRVWQSGTWKCVTIIRGHQHEVTSSVILENIPEICEVFQCQHLIATSSADQTIRFWNFITGELVWIYCGINAFMTMQFVGDKTFIVGDSRGGVHRLQLDN